MFDLGFGLGEILLIAAAALIVIGPKDFPKMMYQCGKFIRRIRDIGSEFKHSIDETVHEQEIFEMRRDIEEKMKMEQDKPHVPK